MNGANANDIKYAVQKAHAAGVKVSISIGGGAIPSCSGNYETILNP
jgi:methylmalonyl-CoA mutase cobalamin-binding subunit